MSSAPATSASDFDPALAGRVRDLVRAETPDLVELRRWLHARPELAYEEEITAQRVREELDAIGVEHVGGLAGGTGTLGHLPGAAERAIGLRADIDALPIEEATGAAWTSTHPGRMHACGHDGHATMLVGAARVLKKLSADGPLPRPVALVFQPAEEGGAGGERMVADGCLDGSVLGPPVDRMYGQHGWPQLELGRVGSRPGPLLAAADQWTAVIHGVGGHAAMPHLAADSVVATAALIQAAQTVVSRTTNPVDPVVLSITCVHAGSAHNVIPPAVELKGTLRTVSPEGKARALEAFRRLVEQVPAAHGCRGELDFRHGYPVTRNDEDAWRRCRGIAEGAVGPELVDEFADPVLGGEDFAYYGQKVPACFFFLGLRPPGASDAADAVPNLHQDTFDFNDEAIPTGVEMLVRLALAG